MEAFFSFGARRVGGSAGGDVVEDFGDFVGGDEGGVEEGGEGGTGAEDGLVGVVDGGFDVGAEGTEELLEGVGVIV